MWWFVGISGLQCFTNGTWIIIGGPPLETTSRVYGGVSRRNAMDRTEDSSVVSPDTTTVLPRIVHGENFKYVIIDFFGHITQIPNYVLYIIK